MKKGFTPLEIRHQRRLDVPPEAGLSLTGFTLLELIMVMVIIAILGVISFPKFSTMKETSIDQEAIANLKLIQAAEKIYRMEEGVYFPHCLTPPCSETDVAEINDHLKLSIPAGANWNYKIEDADAAAFTAKAQRKTDASRVKCIDQDDDDPSDCTW